MGLGIEHRVESDGVGGEVFCNEGVADGIVVNAPLSVEHIEGGSVTGDGIERKP